MDTITLTPNSNIGNALAKDGTPVILDALLTQDCRLFFPSLPNTVFTLQRIDLPEISINQIKQPTRFVDPNQIGEKMKFTPFSFYFIVDKKMRNWSEIYNWMKAITVDGSAVDRTDEPVLVISGVPTLRFVGAWPTNLGGLQFDATNPSAQYVICSLTVNYDYMDLIGNYTTIDSSYI